MARRQASAAFPSSEHDHGYCVSGVEVRAEAAFNAKGLKLTPLRRRVLAEIASSHDAIGAYDLLERIAKDGHRLAPVSVYRIIETLMEVGVVHKLETRQAYYACHGHHTGGRQLVMVCRACTRVAEIDGEASFGRIEAAAKEHAFQTERIVVEVQGLCGRCADVSKSI